MRQRGYGLREYTARRVLEAIPLLLAVIVINFLLIQLSPGDPVLALMGDFPTPPGYVEELRESFGLDRPLAEQLLLYIGRIVKGDLGFSFRYRQPVSELILERVPRTLLLTATALVIGVSLGMFGGIIAAQHRNSWVDSFISSLSLLGHSVPAFWFGQVLMIVFALNLQIFPVQGMQSIRYEYQGFAALVDIGWHLILPAFTLSTGLIATVCRITRVSMLEVMNQDYVVTAYAKGLSRRLVTYRHVLRNALLPIVTIIGYRMGFLLAGSALVETVFGWPGLGRLVYDSIYTRDYPVLLGVFMIVTISIVIFNLITDISYAYLDPRIRY